MTLKTLRTQMTLTKLNLRKLQPIKTLLLLSHDHNSIFYIDQRVICIVNCIGHSDLIVYINIHVYDLIVNNVQGSIIQ